ncbi:Zinc finger, CCHC-type, partial [Trema orientale]
MAKCYILGSVSNILQQQHRGIDTAVDIMLSIDEMFASLGRQARNEATSAFMNLRQKKGTPFWEHMMKVITYLNELEIPGAEIDCDTQIDMILNTLSDTFNQFKIDHEIHRKDYTLTCLMKDLQITEDILKKNRSGSAEANVAQASSSKPKSKDKGKRKKKTPASLSPKKKKTKKNAKLKGKCFHYSEDGHWKRNCKTYLALKKEKNNGKDKQGNDNLLFIKACHVVDSIDSWIVDSGATDYVCNTLQGFKETRKFAGEEFTLRLGDGSIVETRAMGD